MANPVDQSNANPGEWATDWPDHSKEAHSPPDATREDKDQLSVEADPKGGLAREGEFAERTAGESEDDEPILNAPDVIKEAPTEEANKTHCAPGANQQNAKSEAQRPIEADRWNPKAEPERPEPVLTFAGKVPLRRGNVSEISGKAKTGKSALREGMTAAFFGSGDCLGWETNQESAGAVLVFDYEQSKEDFHDSNVRAFQRAGVADSPRFYAYRFRDRPLAERAKATGEAISLAKKEQGGIDLVVFDGGADLIADVNDAEASNEIVDRFLALSSKYNCHVAVIVHTNEGEKSGNDARGHLGKQLQRKAEAVFALKKLNADQTAVHTSRHRKAGIPEEDPFVFEWSDQGKMHVSVGRGIATNKKRQEMSDALFGVAKGDHHFSSSYTDLVPALAAALGQAESTAKTKISYAKKEGLLIVNPANGKYQLGTELREAIHSAHKGQ